jgi:hypothetical protein
MISFFGEGRKRESNEGVGGIEGVKWDARVRDSEVGGVAVDFLEQDLVDVLIRWLKGLQRVIQ